MFLIFLIILKVKWDKDNLDGYLNFYSISGDGRVSNWTIVKTSLWFTDALNITFSRQLTNFPDDTQTKHTLRGRFLHNSIIGIRVVRQQLIFLFILICIIKCVLIMQSIESQMGVDAQRSIQVMIRCFQSERMRGWFINAQPNTVPGFLLRMRLITRQFTIYAGIHLFLRYF